MNRMIMVAAAMGAAILAPAAVQATELVSNGGFETGDFTGWTLFGDPVQLGEWVAVDTLAPNSGTYGAYFGTEDPAGITQTLATQAGQTYTISFALQIENNLGDVTPNSFSVQFGGATLYSITDAPEAGFALFNFTGLATSNATELRFTTTDLTSFLDLDDVSVTASAAPEPATWAMMLAGFGIAGAALRRRRSRPAAA